MYWSNDPVLNSLYSRHVPTTSATALQNPIFRLLFVLELQSEDDWIGLKVFTLEKLHNGQKGELYWNISLQVAFKVAPAEG